MSTDLWLSDTGGDGVPLVLLHPGITGFPDLGPGAAAPARAPGDPFRPARVRRIATRHRAVLGAG